MTVTVSDNLFIFTYKKDDDECADAIPVASICFMKYNKTKQLISIVCRPDNEFLYKCTEQTYETLIVAFGTFHRSKTKIE